MYSFLPNEFIMSSTTSFRILKAPPILPQTQGGTAVLRA